MDERKQKLQAFLGTIEDPDIHDPDLFHRSLKEMIKFFPEISDDFLAHYFGMTRTTAMRWRHGTAAPYPMMRRPVYRFMRSLARRSLNSND